MDWLAQDWFWVALAGVFIGMHFFGHGGCCGGHGDHKAPGVPGKPGSHLH